MDNAIIVKYREAETDKPDWWELHLPVRQMLSDGTEIEVQAGYVTDFASVPPLFWSVIPPVGKYNRAALVHDYLYDLQYKQAEKGGYEARKFCDEEFLRIANLSNPKGSVRHYLMFVFVRLFGRKAWRSCKS